MAEHDPRTAWAVIARHETALATVREFAHRSGAVRVTALLDTGDGSSGAVVEVEPGGPVTFSEGDLRYEVPDDALADIPARPMTAPRPVPSSAWQVDPETGEVAAPIGAVGGLAQAVLELATVLGGRSVATADFATRDGVPVTIAARVGEPLILAVGDAQFELPMAG